MDYKIYNTILLCIMLLCSCVSEKQNNKVYISKERIEFKLPIDTMSLCKRISDIDYISLETPEEAFVYEVDKIITDGRYIYIADFRGHKISVYSNDGKYIYSLNKRGIGPEEYLELRNFTIDGNNIYIIDNYKHKVLIYKCNDGSFAGEKDMPIVADDIEYLADGHFVLGMMPMYKRNMPHSRHLLFIVDSEFKIINRLLPYDKGERVPFAPMSFFKSDEENIYFSSLLFDGFTVIPRNNPDSLYHIAIDFEKRIPDKIRGNSDEIDKGDYQCLCSTPVCCQNYWSFQVDADGYIQTVVYDKNRKLLMANNEMDASKILYDPIASYGNKYITYLADAGIYDELLKIGFPRADKKAETNLENEGAVLIVYTIR